MTRGPRWHHVDGVRSVRAPGFPRDGVPFRRRGDTPAAIAGLVALAVALVGCGGVTGTPVAQGGDSSDVFPIDTGGGASAPESQSEPSAPSSAPESGDVTDYPSGDGVDPCQVVAQADAEKLAGTPLDAPVPGEHACTYTGPVTGPTAQVEVYVGPGAQKQLEIERTLGHDLTELSGIGDEAWRSESGVYARKGQLWISVLVVLLEDPSQYADRLDAIATAAIGHL